jgi:hypothetical protein
VARLLGDKTAQAVQEEVDVELPDGTTTSGRKAKSAAEKEAEAAARIAEANKGMQTLLRIGRLVY